IVADDRLPGRIRDALKAVAPVTVTRKSILPYPFACPSGVLQEGSRRSGMTEPTNAWGDAVAEQG
ncbi:gamma-glutamyltransferase, partial [Rhodovulum sulfidophilum]|nr:gamma-glutamyltransferase [Rhodovulum sulfidophilum]